MKLTAKISILEVTNRPTYELVSLAGPDRPIYIGSREWRERQQQAGKPDTANPDNNRT
jgi:hypothetical protein